MEDPNEFEDLPWLFDEDNNDDDDDANNAMKKQFKELSFLVYVGTANLELIEFVFF